MNNEQNGLSNEERRRRLEQLFQADPFLSPTMRARQLSESDSGEESSAQELQPVTRPAAGAEHSNGNGNGTASAVHAVATRIETPGRMVSLAEARESLRRRAGLPGMASGEPNSLDRLRKDVLTAWLRGMYANR